MGPSDAAGSALGRCLAGRYRITELIGSGGAGNVWAAQDEVLGRRVAVKDVGAPPWLSIEGWHALRERTLREARAAAAIGHPNVVTVYDVVEEDSRPWIVMQLLDARTLAQIVDDEGPCPPRRAAEVGLQVLSALQAAHELGILHRDVKPSNVLVTEDGRAVLTDFGIAMVDGDPALTASGVLVGAPAYIAPERVRGGQAGPASDLWSLGSTLYSAVEGRPPYRRDDPISTIAAVVHEEPDPMTRAGVLAPLIAALLRRDPEERPNVAEVERFLRRVVSAEPGLGAELAAADVEPLSTRPAPMVPVAPAGESATSPTVVGATGPRPVFRPGPRSGPRSGPQSVPLPVSRSGPQSVPRATAAGTAPTAAHQLPGGRRLRGVALLTAAATALLAILALGYLARHTLEPGVPSQQPVSNEPVASEPGSGQPASSVPAGGRQPAAVTSAPAASSLTTSDAAVNSQQPPASTSAAGPTETSAPQESATTSAPPPPTTEPPTEPSVSGAAEVSPSVLP